MHRLLELHAEILTRQRRLDRLQNKRANTRFAVVFCAATAALAGVYPLAAAFDSVLATACDAQVATAIVVAGVVWSMALVLCNAARPYTGDDA